MPSFKGPLLSARLFEERFLGSVWLEGEGILSVFSRALNESPNVVGIFRHRSGTSD